LRYVAASIACEAIADEFAAVHSFALALIMWLVPTIIMSTLGFIVASQGRLFVGVNIVCQCVVYTLVNAHDRAVAVASAAFCAASAFALIRRVLPGDIERSAMLVLLVGNVAVFATMAAFGIDAAYNAGAIAASNNLIHLAIAGLVLWAMRAC
jgi:hypothetical protein